MMAMTTDPGLHPQ